MTVLMYSFFDTTVMAGVKRKAEATPESAPAPLERSHGRDRSGDLDTRTSDKTIESTFRS
jgi:hypothetical protein